MQLCLSIMPPLFCFFIMFLFFYFILSRASRDEMAASAAAGGGTTAYPKSESQNSGLVGNIHGQDVEAAKGSGGGLVY